MRKPECLSTVIKSEALLWGQPEVQGWVSLLKDEERAALWHEEILDWVSSIYWGETLGVQYALEMVRYSNEPDERDFWKRVLAEEVDHQQRIANWLTLRGHGPNKPNRLLEEAMGRVFSARNSDSSDGLAALILWGQVFFEELGAILIRWRLPFVEDRELRSILYKIYADEMTHISAGKRTLERLGQRPPSRKDVLMRKAAVIFPLNLIPETLQGQRSEIRKAGISCVRNLLVQAISDGERYAPSRLLQRWMNVDGYNCIGCHPKRSEGLLLDPQFDHEKGEATDCFSFTRRFEGMNGLVHGGFISMALDEVMGYAINHELNRLAFTTRLEVQFIRPLKVGKKYRVIGKVESIQDPKAKVKGSIVDPETGVTVAQSSADFFMLDESSASKLLPGALSHPETRAMLGGRP